MNTENSFVPAAKELQSENCVCKRKTSWGFCNGCRDCNKGYVKSFRCNCGQLAKWRYDPADREAFYCEACVPRGCSCNEGLVKMGFCSQRTANRKPCCEYSKVKPLHIPNCKRNIKRNLRRSMHCNPFGSAWLPWPQKPMNPIIHTLHQGEEDGDQT